MLMPASSFERHIRPHYSIELGPARDASFHNLRWTFYRAPNGPYRTHVITFLGIRALPLDEVRCLNGSVDFTIPRFLARVHMRGWPIRKTRTKSIET